MGMGRVSEGSVRFGWVQGDYFGGINCQSSGLFIMQFHFCPAWWAFAMVFMSPNDRLKCRPTTAAAQRLEPVKEASRLTYCIFPTEGCRGSFYCCPNRGMCTEESSDTFILYDFHTAKCWLLTSKQLI